MMIRTFPMPQSAVLRLYSEKDSIKMNPIYQRNGEIWTLEKRQLLIDSILNEYDIPKLYFHWLKSEKFEYAVIDGRQRLETIFAFIDGKFPLANDFEYFMDRKIKVGGLTYESLSQVNQKLKMRFDAYTLPVILVETKDQLLIDDMFSRLNEAVSLNAAEKRNALGGNAVLQINTISEHSFFKNCVKFSNKRYQHKEVAARLLFIAWNLLKNNRKLLDTKKALMDNFVKTNRDTNFDEINELVVSILSKMEIMFDKKDNLLRSQANIPIYFLATRAAEVRGKENLLSREKLVEFRKALETNRRTASKDISKANFELLEFDRLSQQGTNDASSIINRYRILTEWLGILSPPKETR